MTPDAPKDPSIAGFGSRKGGLFGDSTDALKAVRDDFLYWTGRLTDTTFQLSVAVIGANWAIFHSLREVRANCWATTSLILVILSLAVAVLGAKRMGELHAKQIKYAGADVPRWERECTEALGKDTPWPFTKEIQTFGRVVRELKMWLTLLAGAAFFVALLTASVTPDPPPGPKSGTPTAGGHAAAP